MFKALQVWHKLNTVLLFLVDTVNVVSVILSMMLERTSLFFVLFCSCLIYLRDIIKAFPAWTQTLAFFVFSDAVSDVLKISKLIPPESFTHVYQFC